MSGIAQVDICINKCAREQHMLVHLQVKSQLGEPQDASHQGMLLP